MPTNSLSKVVLIGTFVSICIFWTSLLFAIISVISIFLSLPPNVRHLDFAGGTVVHTKGWISLLYFMPIVSLLFLRWHDRTSLLTRLGRATILASVIYYLFSIICILSLIYLVPPENFTISFDSHNEMPGR